MSHLIQMWNFSATQTPKRKDYTIRTCQALVHKKAHLLGEHTEGSRLPTSMSTLMQVPGSAVLWAQSRVRERRPPQPGHCLQGAADKKGKSPKTGSQ